MGQGLRPTSHSVHFKNTHFWLQLSEEQNLTSTPTRDDDPGA